MRGWIGPPDASIRQAARSIVRQAEAPFDIHLISGLVNAWKTMLPGVVWLMPKSHWAYELEFGHRELLYPVLQQIGVNPTLLEPLNTASAIEFTDAEQPALEYMVKELLNRLVSSDFQIVFPGFSTICTLHTRCQLWWTTTDARLIDFLDAQFPAHANDNP